MAAIEFKRLTQDEILALLEREADAEVPVERISSDLEEPDEAFLEELDPLLIEPEAEQLPCESILGPKSNESDDSGRGSGDIPMGDPRSGNHSEMEEKGVIGLLNLGNSCYMNAGLQCLLSTPALVDYFGSRPNGTRKEPENSRAKLLRTFGFIFSKVWGPHRPDDGILKLTMFKLYLGQCHGVFKGTGQQDCQEFITLLLDTLDEQLKVKILRGQKDSKETKNCQPMSASTVPKQNDLARSLPSSSTVNSSSNSPLKLSSMFNRRVYLPKVKNSVKSLNVLPQLSIITSFPNLQPSNAQDSCDENNIRSDYQVAKASGFSKFGSKQNQQKSSKASPPAKRVRLGSENEPTGRSGRTAALGIQELKISDDDDEEDSQRVPELNRNVNQVSNTNGCEVMCERELHPQTRLLWKANQIAAGIAPQNPLQVETFETETTCSVITTAFEGALTRTITCANCNHQRSESEPFKNLTLPIPRDADRLIQLFFVSIYDVDLPKRWTKLNLTLRLSQTVQDLKQTFVSMLAKSDHDCQPIKMEDLIMAYVWDHQIHEYIPDDVQVRFLNETKSLFLFQVNSDFPNTHNNGFPNGHNNSPLAVQESSVDYDASTLVLDEETTLCTSDLEGSTSKTECCVSCATCWKTCSRDNVRVNAECECVLCLECIEELTKKARKNERYKCPQCTQIVAFKSLCPVDVLKLCRIVYMNQTWGESCYFGCPMLVRLPSQLLVQDLRQFFTQVGVEICDDDRYDILLLSYSPQRCVMCGPDSYCRGCPLLRSGPIFIPDSTTIVIRFLDLLPQDMEYFNPTDMADEAGVDFDPDYTFVQAFHINDCLDLYTGKERLEHPSLCVQCGKTGEASKSLAISHCPDYVILNVERHGFGISQKLENPIEFNLKLDLSKYLASGCTQDANYDLYGVVCHSGGASWGHYTAFVKNPWTLKWYFCDDSKVVPQDPDQLIYSSAYILFWSRQGTSLKSNLEFPPVPVPPPVVKNNSPVRPPVFKNNSPVPPPVVKNNSPVVVPSSSNFSQSKKSCKVIGLSRRKRPQVLPQSSSSSRKIPRKTLFVGKEKSYSPTIRNEIMADWTDDEAEESRKAGDSDDVDNCTNFIGRNDHLPYYQGVPPPNVLNGHIDPNLTYTLDSDPPQGDEPQVTYTLDSDPLQGDDPLQVDDPPVDFTLVSDPRQVCDSWR